METVVAPEDHETRTIIDKLASFVARNGPEFEQMTKEKQRENSKFQFLFGGEHYQYYQFRVNVERAILKNSISHAQPNWQQPNILNQQVGSLQEQVHQMEEKHLEKIKESEHNLHAQYQSLTQQQQLQIVELIEKSEADQLRGRCEQCGINANDIDSVLEPLIRSCSKDNISNGKNWVLTNTKSYAHAKCILDHLLRRIMNKQATFECRLHLIYLMNDLLHSCFKKHPENSEHIKSAIQSVLVPAFCTTFLSCSNDEQKLKLTKLLTIWRNNNYFDIGFLDQLNEPQQAITGYQTSLMTRHSDIVNTVSQTINEQYSKLQSQHQQYAEHLKNQLQTKRNELEHLQLELTQQQNIPQVSVPMSIAHSQPPPLPVMHNQPNMSIPPPQFGINQPPANIIQPDFNQPLPNYAGPPNFNPSLPSQASIKPATAFDYQHGANRTKAPLIQDYHHGQTPVGPQAALPAIELPDLSKPPPGFLSIPQNPVGPKTAAAAPPPFGPDSALIPTVPYHELPAGLMVPLIQLEDSEYRPLDPSAIRLPPPVPPSEKLIAAIEAYYAPPNHDKPRDSDGWEKLGLYEFYKSKKNAREAQGFDVSSNGQRSNSHSPKRLRYRSRSRTPKHRFRSPTQSRTPSESPEYIKSRSRSPVARRSRSRSVTPPWKVAVSSASVERRLEDNNRGFNLMRKMGWSGERGLGVSEQGITDPLDGGEVRDRSDLYKGVGVPTRSSDPFEAFRKNRSSRYSQSFKEKRAARKAEAGME